MSYINKTEIEQYMGVQIDASLQTFIDTLISAVTRYIEQKTGSKFEAPDPDSDVTRYYNGNGRTKINIDHLREFTSLVVDGINLVENDDFIFYPMNAVADGKPFDSIELIQPETRLSRSSRIEVSSPYVFEKAQRNVVLTGKFGYSETAPEDIKVACLKMVASLIKENIGDRELKELSSESLGDYSVSFVKVSDFADRLGINDILAPYIAPIIKPQTVRGTMRQVS